MNVYVIIPAGGSGTRFGSDLPKQFLPLGETTILNQTLKVFLEADVVQIVVCLPEQHLQHRSLLQDSKINYVAGGQSRSASVHNGFMALSSVSEDDVVLVHDAARPFVTKALIESVAAATQKTGSAIPGAALTDTIKTKSKEGCVVKTIPRDELFAIQTPQGFLAANLKKAYDSLDFANEQYTDESMLMEALGVKVALVEGERQNFKITTPFDLEIAEVLVR